MKKMTITILGLGDRGLQVYGNIISQNTDTMELVAVADCNLKRLALAQNKFALPDSCCFPSEDALFAKERLSDIMFICTQDADHVRHAILAIERGYHVLLEKPISANENECRRLLETANKYNRKVCICHVLRYTPFYSTIKTIIDDGKIGRLMTIQAREDVGFFHMAHSYVRGNWRRSDETSPMIMAKCCHDLDLFVWLTGSSCTRLSSFGSLSWFKEENAPVSSGSRCMLDCPNAVKAACPYDCEKIYITDPKSGIRYGNSWPSHILMANPTEDGIREILKTSPYGRCVYCCDNNVVDHQQVNMLMGDEILCSLSMTGFSNSVNRMIKVMGTMGEIEGDFNEEVIYLRRFGYPEQVIDLKKKYHDFEYHGGGDGRMVKQVMEYVMNDKKEFGITDLISSIESHLMAIAAEESRLNDGKVIEIKRG
ncbi:MAG: Gfo/Idh/MocA family oxidoreductase [Lachnospiraceae bacterium]|nr:Gfo/Idh/MocA family oxidoreductase [Lachnospiraceae bacterium]